MIENLRVYQNRHLDNILTEMNEYSYRFKRYNNTFSVVLFYAIESLKDDLVTTTLRTTDHYSKLEENLFLIILGETGIEGGIIASEKLLLKLRCKPGQLIYSAVAECSKEKEGVSLVLQLFNILEFAVEHQHTDEVVDSSYLDGIY